MNGNCASSKRSNGRVSHGPSRPPWRRASRRSKRLKCRRLRGRSRWRSRSRPSRRPLRVETSIAEARRRKGERVCAKRGLNPPRRGPSGRAFRSIPSASLCGSEVLFLSGSIDDFDPLEELRQFAAELSGGVQVALFGRLLESTTEIGDRVEAVAAAFAFHLVGEARDGFGVALIQR